MPSAVAVGVRPAAVAVVRACAVSATSASVAVAASVPLDPL